MDSAIHEEDCFVHQLGESNCFLCVVEEHVSDTCPHANYFGFLYIFCTHPYRDDFQRRHLPEDHPIRTVKDIPPGKK
jgi:hypothetical protein